MDYWWISLLGKPLSPWTNRTQLLSFPSVGTDVPLCQPTCILAQGNERAAVNQATSKRKITFSWLSKTKKGEGEGRSTGNCHCPRSTSLLDVSQVDKEALSGPKIWTVTYLYQRTFSSSSFSCLSCFSLGILLLIKMHWNMQNTRR